MTSNRHECSCTDFDTALDRVREGEFERSDIERLLSPRNEQERDLIFKTAREIKEKHFSNKIFLYGFIYFSTFCKNNCSFCFFRKENKVAPRYRKDREEIMEIAESLVQEGVNLLDLTSGDDPYFQHNFDELLEIIKEISDLEDDVSMMVSPGVVNERRMKELRDAGVDWYALYQETHNPKLYEKLRLNQSFSEREKARKNAAKAGMMVEDGILLGVGETKEDLANSIFTMSKEDLGQARCMLFVRHEGVPLPKEGPPADYSLVTALLRITNPSRLVPATLDVGGLKGIEGLLDAGANVVTSIILPNFQLAGVAQHEYGIENGERSPSSVESFLKKKGLKPASNRSLKLFQEEHIGAEGLA